MDFWWLESMFLWSKMILEHSNNNIILALWTSEFPPTTPSPWGPPSPLNGPCPLKGKFISEPFPYIVNVNIGFKNIFGINALQKKKWRVSLNFAWTCHCIKEYHIFWTNKFETIDWLNGSWHPTPKYDFTWTSPLNLNERDDFPPKKN